MDFLELAQKRYSVREFSAKKVEQNKIDKILAAARIAPTACNNQPQRILVLTEEEELKRMKECTRFDFDAPIIFIICYDNEVSWKRKLDGKDEGEVDAAIVTTHMMLEVSDLELGSTWVGSFDPNKVREIFNIPSNYEIVSILPVGYPSEDNKPNSKHLERQGIEKIAFYHTF